MEHSRPFHKGVFLLPNLLTVCSLFMGFLSMLWCFGGRFEHAALAIFASMFFDGMDGKIARLTNTQSDFGVQLDSLCDLVAFGVAPAMMMFMWQLDAFGRMGLMTAFLFTACGALRLARFNVQSASACKKHFIGLPIPAAAATLSSFLLFSPYLPDGLASILPSITLVMTLILSILMVSRVRYASFKDGSMAKAYPFGMLVILLLLFVLVISHPRPVSFLTLMAYVLSGPVYTTFVLSRRAQKVAGELHPKIQD